MAELSDQERITWQEEDIRGRIKAMAFGDHGDWTNAKITHVGHLKDDDTGQHVDLYRLQMVPDEDVGVYDCMTATYIWDFWGDAHKRGEPADVVVFNSVDGYKAVDPAEEMFPSGDKAGS